jgi:hypothetical protein
VGTGFRKKIMLNRVESVGVVELSMSERLSASRALIVRIVCVLVLGAVVAGCDRCGDFLPPMKFKMQACKDEAPRPQ